MITHSQLLGDGENKTVQVHFERPVEGGFDSARCELPSYKWIKREGFTDDEIKKFTRFLENNAHLIFRFADNGGILSA